MDRAVVDRVVVGLDKVLVVRGPEVSGAVTAEAVAGEMDRAVAVAGTGRSRVLEGRGSGSSRS
ncbi:hypothetical protein SAMN05443639_107104 [Stigmatella erecta]|uniref:Uncharacterized protein n=1 Tax=Stigmatella erecta TaxID=83460 RepID=A0A1I0JAV1_9BACT|nr:hypothetical protein SAMN05443639_107104 [Stigmatella erecta]